MKKRVLGFILGMLIVLTAVPIIHAEESNNKNQSSEAVIRFEAPANALILETVPKIAFGEGEISADESKHFSTNLTPSIKVTDLRGTGEGWKLLAELSPFKNEVGVESLPGSSITFKKGILKSDTDSAFSPETYCFTLNFGEKSSSQRVTLASKNKGMGLWETRWDESLNGRSNENVFLTVPAGVATKGTHKATITWTLISDPQ